MAISDDLARRYLALFKEYGTGGSTQTYGLKREIMQRQEVLREDAMYFLLVNFDLMVVRAFSGYVPDIDMNLGEAMKEFRSPAETDDMVKKGLKIIDEELAKTRPNGQKSSANDVVRALNATAEKISEVILWWRE